LVLKTNHGSFRLEKRLLISFIILTQIEQIGAGLTLCSQRKSSKLYAQKIVFIVDLVYKPYQRDLAKQVEILHIQALTGYTMKLATLMAIVSHAVLRAIG